MVYFQADFLFWAGVFILLCCLSARGALIGNSFQISGPGCRFPDVAYGSADQKYLVVWPDYNVSRIYGRFVMQDGSLSGGAFPISEAPHGALYPAIAYNATNNEFLVTWDDAGSRGGVIYGQRVRGSDGALMGTNFAIGTIYGGIRSAVAWSPINNTYLVVYWGPGSSAPEVYGRRVSANGTLPGANFNISNDAPFSGYPAIAWGPSVNQFLVSWDNEDGNIHGRRVDASNGSLLAVPIIVTAGGAKDRSCVAYDSVNNRWLVQFNNAANAGFSYDQYGQRVRLDGMLDGGPFPIAHTPGFEGDTQFGGDVAFVPIAGRFFSSFGTDTGMGGQESFANGAAVGQQVVLGTGYYTSLNNAADPQHNRFLTAWEGLVGGSFQVLGQLYGTTINPVTNFTAAGEDSRNVLAWRNPGDAHFTGTTIRGKSTGYPTGPDDGLLVVDKAGAPGANDSFTHTNLTNWTTYYYAAFAHDVGPNYSLAQQYAATPRPPVTIIDSSEFTTGMDGWAPATWRSGSLAVGTIAHDTTAGNIVSGGSGQSNNRDSCAREGSTMTKGISTAGQHSIQVEYDVMAALNAPPTGNPAGSCAVLAGTLEDKLAVYYSTSGTNGPWSVAQILSEGLELPTGWTRKLVNLAGIAAVNDNPGFALRFQWQFNHVGDTGRVDNVRVLSGAVTAPSPSIVLSRATIERTVQAGQTLPNEIFHVSNTGEGILNFAVSEAATWLSVSPVTSSSPGPPRQLTLSYNVSSLAIGDYEAAIQVTSTNANNAPQTLVVKLRVIPVACFQEAFDYYDGNLTVMGYANWSGAASNQLQVESSVLKILGGGGLVSASHPISCAGSNGCIGAQIKIKKGTGTGDFFWNIAIDDPAGNNLARCYGGSTIARGRVGNEITSDMLLSSSATWDDLYVKIDTAANTSEFFFNGTSFRVIPHGATPGDSVGSIRIERLDRSSAANDLIYFDNLVIGPPDTSQPKLDVMRSGTNLILSWLATGAGARLQSTATLTPPIAWSTVSGLVVTNGEASYTTSFADGEKFFRLSRP